MLDRYINFAQTHPRLSASVSVLGVGTMVLGASGTPSDVENWGKVFAAVGSDGGRWLLVFLGLALVVVAVTPLLTRKRATESEVSSTPSPGRPASPTQRNQTAPPKVSPVKQVASADAALDKLYTEGHRMFKASDWIAGANILYGSPPTEGEIDRWQGRVRQALPQEYRRRFRFAPLRASALDLGSLGLAKGLEPIRQKRMRESLAELERIMTDMDEAKSGRV